MLKKERLTFGNQLEGLDNTLKKQDEEIEKLKVGFKKKKFKFINPTNIGIAIGTLTVATPVVAMGEVDMLEKP